MFDWDDLRIFLAAARASSLTGAAGQLGIDAATVGRRIARLETSLKATLFVRSQNGLQLTAAGAHLLEAGKNAEEAMAAAQRAGEPDIVGGTVRISASEGFGTAILAPALVGLRRLRPGLRIELAATAGFLSPSKREVDMAITLSAPDGVRLVVEPLTNYQLALYAAPRYLARRGTPRSLEQLAEHDLVGYIGDLIYAPELRYLEEIGADLRPSLSSSSIRGQQEMIAAGGGVGALPCFLAAGLTRVVDEVLISRRFWLSTHRDVASTARMRAVGAWLRNLVEDKQADLTPFPVG